MRMTPEQERRLVQAIAGEHGIGTAVAETPALLTPKDPAWHAARQVGVGSSESPALFGCGFKGESPMKVYLSKIMPPEALANDEGTRAMRRGTKLEQALAEDVADQRGWRLARVPTQRDVKGDPMVSSLDFVILGDDGVPWAILECKTAAYRTLKWGDPDLEPDGVPERVLIQTRHQMAVGLDWNGVRIYPRKVFVGACVKHLDDVRVYELDWREPTELAIRAQVRKFWTEHVVPKIPPPWDGTEAGDKLLRLMYPVNRAPLRRIADSDPIAAVVRERSEIHAGIVAATEKRDTLDQRIKDEIGEADGIALSDGAVTWKATKDRVSVDHEAVSGDLQRELAGATSEAFAREAAAAAVKANTTTKPGSRVLRGPWSNK